MKADHEPSPFPFTCPIGSYSFSYVTSTVIVPYLSYLVFFKANSTVMRNIMRVAKKYCSVMFLRAMQTHGAVDEEETLPLTTSTA